MNASYLVPIRKFKPEDLTELGAYLEEIALYLEVIVVDGSANGLFEQHSSLWPSCIHIRPASESRTANGKVWGVLTGLALASHDNVVIADEDVRYGPRELSRLLLLLDEAEIVRPQNYFDPLPWHARLDTGRTLINRSTGRDWPGTLAVKRSVLERTRGYDGDCLFENLELVRTVRAAGGREVAPLDLFVARRPPTTRHFLSQRVRQAYDEFARPIRMGLQLSLLPLALIIATTRPQWLLVMMAFIWGLAEFGRRRGQGAKVFPASASLLAPIWLSERAVCVWLAVLSRILSGGVPYNGGIIRKSANSQEVLQRKLKLTGERA